MTTTPGPLPGMVASAGSTRQLAAALAYAELTRPENRMVRFGGAAVLLLLGLGSGLWGGELLLGTGIGALCALLLLVLVPLLQRRASLGDAHAIAPEGAKLRAGFRTDGRLWCSHARGWDWVHPAAVQRLTAHSGHTVLELEDGSLLGLPDALFRADELALFVVRAREGGIPTGLTLPEVSAAGTVRGVLLSPESHQLLTSATRSLVLGRPSVLGLLASSGLCMLLGIWHTLESNPMSMWLLALGGASLAAAVWVVRGALSGLRALAAMPVRTTLTPTHVFVESPGVGEAWPLNRFTSERRGRGVVLLQDMAGQTLCLAEELLGPHRLS